ncbi:MAG: adenine deaminase [Candidatus Thorarchaeota archaeon]
MSDADVKYRESLVKAALGIEKADLVLRHGNVINVCSGEIEHHVDVAVKGKHIILVGDARDTIGPDTKVVDCIGKYIVPGLFDAHMHFESSMLTITEFAKASVPTGTLTLFADPHEIVNAVGKIGTIAMIEELRSAQIPQRVFLLPPSLTPDCPGLETPGVEVSREDVRELLEYPEVGGVGEVQGFTNVDLVMKHAPHILPLVIDSAVAAMAKGKIIQGNAPFLFGPQLAAHLIAGSSDCHETSDEGEVIEKVRRGMYVLMREGSTQHNLRACLRGIKEAGLGTRFLVHCTDDMCPPDLLDPNVGHINNSIRVTLEEGYDVVEAVQMATINPAIHYHLDRELGSITPGKIADIVVVSDITVDGWRTTDIDQVYFEGRLVASKGKVLVDIKSDYVYPDAVKKSVYIEPTLTAETFDYPAPKGKDSVLTRVVGLIEFENLSEEREIEMSVRDGKVHVDLDRDILKMAVVGRYKASAGEIGKGFVQGFGMKSGAVAETVSHDTHNIMVMGASEADMALACNEVIKMQGGVAVVDQGKVLGTMALPIAGLISEYDVQTCNDKVDELVAHIERLGSPIHMPLMHLAFLSLATSPYLKLTTKGYVEAHNYRVVPMFVD